MNKSTELAQPSEYIFQDLLGAINFELDKLEKYLEPIISVNIGEEKTVSSNESTELNYKISSILNKIRYINDSVKL